MKKYRKKPLVIKAIKFKDPYSLMEAFPELRFHAKGDNYWIETLEGKMQFTYGDYIIQGIKNEFYPCKPDIFEATYEEVE